MSTEVEWLTPAEVAKKRGGKTHVVTVRRALESGELHGHQRKRRGHWSVNALAVDAWITGLDGTAACGCARLRSVGRRAA